jgi:integrase
MAKLTVKAIEHAKPGKARREIPDGLVSGLYLQVQPSGARSWAVRYRMSGKSRKYTLGSYPALDLATARKLAGKALARVAEGYDPAVEAAARAAAAESDSVEAVAAEYLQRYVRPHCRPRTVIETERMLGRAVAAWRGRPISGVTKRDVIAHLDRVHDQNGPIASNRARGALSGFFRWLVERSVLDASPAIGLPRPAPEPSRERVLTDDELKRIWVAADALPYPTGAFTQLLVLTAQRRSEVAEAAWAEIDLQARVWRLPGSRTKNKRAHEVALSGLACSILEALPCIGLYVLGGQHPACNFAGYKAKLDILAQVPGWTFHDLRRTAATRMADIGIAPHVIGQILNHVDGRRRGVASVYNRSRYEDEARSAMERWASHVAALVEGRTSNVVSLAARG